MGSIDNTYYSDYRSHVLKAKSGKLFFRCSEMNRCWSHERNKCKMCEDKSSLLLSSKLHHFQYIWHLFQNILKPDFIILRSWPALILWQCVGSWLCGLAWSKPYCATPHIRSNNLLLCQYFALYAEWWKKGLWGFGKKRRRGNVFYRS